MKTVIATLNTKFVHSSLAPWYLASALEAYTDGQVAAEVIEGTINESTGDVIARILAQEPQVIGFCCYIWNIKQTLEMLGPIKQKLPQCKIVLGGPEVSYNARTVLMENPLVDYIISGEGEEPFSLLIHAIAKNDKTEAIPGLCYRSEEEIVISPPNIGRGEPPSPYSQRYFAALNGRIAYLETSRGCPYSCTFCLSGRCGTVRYFGEDRAKAEILQLANSGAQTVKLVDRTFNANRKRAYGLFQFILENYGKAIPSDVCFHFEVGGDLLDDNTIRLLAAAPPGAIQLEIGIQSFHPRTLKAIRRETSVDRLKQNIAALIRSANIHIHIDLIAGLPYADWSVFAEDFNTAYALRPHMLQVGFLKLLHGSPMRDSPEAFPCEYGKEPPYEVVSTPWMSSMELGQLRALEDALDRLYNSGRFRRTLAYLLSQCALTPFELFYSFGVFAAGCGTYRISLDGYTELLIAFFGKQSPIILQTLYDTLVCDRLAFDSSGVIPKNLQNKNPIISRIKKEMEKHEWSKRHPGIKRGLALMRSEACIVYVDYENKDPVTGEYPLRKACYQEQGQRITLWPNTPP